MTTASAETTEFRSSALVRKAGTARLERMILGADAATVLLAVSGIVALSIGADGSLSQGPLLIVAVALLVTWPLALSRWQSTSRAVLGGGLEEYRRVLVASAFSVGVAAVVAYLADAGRAKGFLLVAGSAGTALLLAERRVVRAALQRAMTRGHPLLRVYVVAAPSRESAIARSLDGGPGKYQKVGAWHLRPDQDPEPEDVIRAALARGADTILYAPLGNEDTHWTRRLGWAMEDDDLSLLVSPSLVEVAGPRLSIEPVEGLTFVRVDMPRFSGPARIAKRAMDIVGSLVGLALLGIPMLVIAVVIRRDSPGPAIFKQVRAGIRSSTFECWKFRTMSTGADAQRAALRAAHEAQSADRGATFKMVDDPRVTRTGQWLRRYSIDELPQLVNVLRGQMSLVGPRPHPLDDVARYDEVATRRLLAKPGMTGLWQVSGRSDIDWEQAVRLDLYYVENWSLALDILLLLRTVAVVFRGSGAY